jgi:RNA polymerase sigma-70 factor (ECF subfamily)
MLYEEFYPAMMQTAMRYAGTREDAQDIVHESFIKVFKNIDKYHSGTSLGAWIKTIVVNTSIDFYRKDIKNRTEDIEEAKNVSSYFPMAIDHLAAEEILTALQKLTPSYRSVFNLYVIEGYSHKEISKMLGINESTCRSNLVKARTKIKEYLLQRDKFFQKP